MGTHGDQGDEGDADEGKHVEPGLDAHAEGILPEKAARAEDEDGQGKGKAQRNEAQVVGGKEGQDAGCGGAEDLADTDFLGSLRRREGGQAEEPQGGDEDGEDGEHADDTSEEAVGLVLLVEVILQEEILEGIAGKEIVVAILDAVDGLAEVFHSDTDGDLTPVAPAGRCEPVEVWLEGFPQ